MPSLVLLVSCPGSRKTKKICDWCVLLLLRPRTSWSSSAARKGQITRTRVYWPIGPSMDWKFINSNRGSTRHAPMLAHLWDDCQTKRGLPAPLKVCSKLSSSKSNRDNDEERVEVEIRQSMWAFSSSTIDLRTGAACDRCETGPVPHVPL